MPIARFQMPDGRIARFEVPEGTTPEQAQALAPQLLAQIPAEPEPETGFLPALESGFRTAIGSGAVGFGELTGLEGVSQYGREVLAGQPGYRPITSEEVGQAFDQGVLPGLGAGTQYVTEATGEIGGGLPAYIGTAVAGAKTGAALMPVPQFKPAAALAGSVIAPAMTYFFGQNKLAQEEQIRKAEEQGVPPPQFSDLETFGYGLLQSGVERTGISILARRFPVLNRLFGGNKADAEAAARELAEQGRAAAFGRGAVAGVATEVPVEVAQQILERQASGQELTSDEALAEYIEVMKRTTAGMAPIGGVTGVASRRGAVKQQEQAKLDEQRAQYEQIRAQAQQEAEAEAEVARVEGVGARPDYGIAMSMAGVDPLSRKERVVSGAEVVEETEDTAPLVARLQETAKLASDFRQQQRKVVNVQEAEALADKLNAAITENLLTQAQLYRTRHFQLKEAGLKNQATGALRLAQTAFGNAYQKIQQIKDPEARATLAGRVPKTLAEVGADADEAAGAVPTPTPTPTPAVAATVAQQLGIPARLKKATEYVNQLDLNTPEGRASAREAIDAIRDSKGIAQTTLDAINQSPLAQQLDAEREAPVEAELEGELEGEDVGDFEAPTDKSVVNQTPTVTELSLEEYARMWAEATAAKNQAGADAIRSEALRTYKPTDFQKEIESAVMRLAAEKDIDITKSAKSQEELDRDARWSKNQDENLRASLQDENTLGALEALKKNENPVIAAVAQRFDEIPTTTPAINIDEGKVTDAAKRVLGEDTDTRFVGGMYDPSTNTVTMRDELAAGNPEFVAHELAHAQAYKVINTKPKNLTATQRAGVEQLKKLYDYVVKNASKEAADFAYGLTSVDEFLSEGMSNKRFQDYLKTIEYKNTNAWTAFVEAIAKMLGLKPDTAFTELLSAYEQITTRPEAKPVSKSKQTTPAKTPEAPAVTGTAEELTEAAMQRYAKAYKQARKTDKFPGEEAVRVRGEIEKAIKEAGGKKAPIAKVRGVIAKTERVETERLTLPARKKAEAKAKQEAEYRKREAAAQAARQQKIKEEAEKAKAESEKREAARRARGAAGVSPTDVLQEGIERQLNELRNMAAAKRRGEMRPLLEKIIERVRQLNPDWRKGDSIAKIVDSVIRAPRSTEAFLKSIRAQYDPMYQAYIRDMEAEAGFDLTDTDVAAGRMRQDFEQQMARVEALLTETDALTDAEIDELMGALTTLKNPKADPEKAVEAQQIVEKYDAAFREEVEAMPDELLFKIVDGKKVVHLRESSIKKMIAEYAMSTGETRAYIGMIDPKGFVRINTKDQTEYNDIFEDNIYINEDGSVNTQALLAGWPRIPYIKVKKGILEGELGEVVWWSTHEGRHRMAAMAVAGIDRVPVVVAIDDIPYMKPESMRDFLADEKEYRDMMGEEPEGITITAPNFSGGRATEAWSMIPLSWNTLPQIREVFDVIPSDRVTETSPEVEAALEEDKILFKIATNPEAEAAAQARIARSGGRIFDTNPEPSGPLNRIKQAGYKTDADGNKVKKTREDHIKAGVTFLDGVMTKFLSSDAAVNAAIRRRLREMTENEQEIIGRMLDISTSQAFHAEALASNFLEFGNLKYDNEIHKWTAEPTANNYKTLVGKLESIAEKYGLSLSTVESEAHRYAEARRLVAIRNEQIVLQRKIDVLEKSKKRKDRVLARELKKYSDRHIHMTDKQISDAMSSIDAIPEYAEVFDIWNGMRENALNLMTESGLVSEAQAEVWLDNADYVPFYREQQLESNEGPREFISGLVSDPKLKRFKGSENMVNNVFDNMVRWTEFYVEASVRNYSARQIMDEMLKTGIATEGKPAPAEANKQVAIWVDGQKTFYTAEHPLFVEAFTGMESAGIPTMKLMVGATNFLRKSVVLNPIFSLGQLTQDAFGAMFASGLPVSQSIKLLPKVLKEFVGTLRGTSAAHEELRRMGAVGVRDYSAAVVRREMESFVTNLNENGGGMRAKAMRFLEDFSMASDNAVRQAVYELSRASGETKAVAAERAFEIINFRRKGSNPVVQWMNRMVPFFNAYLQALNVQIKTFTGEGVSPRSKKSYDALLANAAAVAAFTALYTFLMSGDDDYESQEGYVRNRMLMMPGAGGFGIPLRTDLFLLPKVLTENTVRLMMDSPTEDMGTFVKALKEALSNGMFGPTAVPQIAKPSIEWALDYNFHTERSLVPRDMANVEAWQQFNEYSSEFSKFLGEYLDVSPMKLDHWIRGTFGSVGAGLLWTSNMYGVGSGFRPAMSAQDTISSIPGMGRFLTKEHGSGYKGMLYDSSRLVNEAVETFNKLKATDPMKLEPWLSADDKRLARLSMEDHYNDLTEEMARIRKEIRLMSLRTDIDADIRSEVLDILREQEALLLESMDLKTVREIVM